MVTYSVRPGITRRWPARRRTRLGWCCLGRHIGRARDVLDKWGVLGQWPGTDRITLGAMVFALPRAPSWKVARETLTIEHSRMPLVLPVGLGGVGPAAIRTQHETVRRVRAEKPTSASYPELAWSGRRGYRGTQYWIQTCISTRDPSAARFRSGDRAWPNASRCVALRVDGSSWPTVADDEDDERHRRRAGVASWRRSIVRRAVTRELRSHRNSRGGSWQARALAEAGANGHRESWG